MKPFSFSFLVCAVALLLHARSLQAQTPSWSSIATGEVKLDTARAFCIYVSDINNDQYPDVVTIDGDATEDPLRVYLNIHDTGSSDPSSRMFVDITASSGVNAKPGGGPSRGSLVVALADINNDGNVDMVRGNYYHVLSTYTDYGDRCEVLLGDGSGHFTLVPDNGLHALGLLNTIGFSFLDYDKDGKVDLFIATWFKDYENNIWSPGYLLKGNGDGTFTNVSAQAGITAPEPMYGCSAVDWNNDGWPDIATAPYCRTEGQLWKNNGNGTFTNVAASAGYNAQYLPGDNGQPMCMWSAVPEDFDNDGDMDFFFTLVHGGNDAGEGRSAVVVNGGAANNYMLTPDRSRLAKRVPYSSHNGDYDGSWFDLDNDGLMDLAMTQGHYTPATDRLFIFHQDEHHMFTDITGDLDLILPESKDLHLLEVMDYDLDGDDDIIFCRNGQPRTLQLVENRIGQDNSWTAVQLRAPEGVNKSCIGARIYVWSGGVQRMREVYAGRGNASGQQPFAMVFGLGQHTVIDSVKVRWPDAQGSTTTVHRPPVNSYLEITSSGLSVPGAQQAQDAAPGLKLYPNPAKDFILVQISDNTAIARMEVYDVLGKRMPVKLYDDNNGTRYCTVKGLPPAQYIMKVTAAGGATYTRTFVKEE